MLKQLTSAGFNAFFKVEAGGEIIERQLDNLDQASELLNNNDGYAPAFACGVYSGCELIH